MKLFELTSDYVEALDNLSEMLEDGSIDGEGFDEAFLAMEGEIDEKIINFAAYIKNLSADIKPMEEAIDNMRKRLKALKGKDEKFRGMLLACMERMNKSKVKSPLFDVKTDKNPPKLIAVFNPVSTIDAVIEHHPSAIIEDTSVRVDLNQIKTLLKDDDEHPLNNWYSFKGGKRLSIK